MNVVCYIGSAEPLCCDTLKTHLGACVPNECIHAFDDFEGMLQAVKSASGRAVLFADRYFFGFHMENQMYRLLLANPLTDVVIVSEKALEKVFVLRLHNMGAQAVLEGIFSAPGIANDIVQVLNGAKLLPERVADAVRNGETRNWAKLYSPPAMREYMVLCL